MMPLEKMEKEVKMIHHSDQHVGTLGGTIIAFIGIVDGSDILKTGILACVGAIISFGASKGLHQIWPPKVVKATGRNTNVKEVKRKR